LEVDAALHTREMGNKDKITMIYGLSVGHFGEQRCTRMSMGVGMPPQRSAWLMA
jgi:hypothetical protein